MGVTGVGLFAADVACDIRSAYREAMEDGAEDADAERAVLEAAGFLDTRDREAPVIRFLDFASTDLPDAGTLALIPDRAAHPVRWRYMEQAVVETRGRQPDDFAILAKFDGRRAVPQSEIALAHGRG
jgi:hypothetical protein